LRAWRWSRQALAAASACASAAPGSRVYVRVGPGYLVI
jgi:hypothetical protein